MTTEKTSLTCRLGGGLHGAFNGSSTVAKNQAVGEAEGMGG